MSAVAQILAQVREIIEEAVSHLRRHEGVQDGRIDRLEERVAAVEDRLSPASAKARPATKAQAGVAKGGGVANP